MGERLHPAVEAERASAAAYAEFVRGVGSHAAQVAYASGGRKPEAFR